MTTTSTTMSSGSTLAWSHLWTKTFPQVLKHLVLAGLGLLFLFPFAWLVLTSFKTPGEIMMMPPPLFPEHWQWSNYVRAVQEIEFFRYMGNTLTLFVAKAVGAVLSCSLAAYGFSRLNWPGRDMVFLLVLATMMLPFQVTMIPLYITWTRLDLVGTYYPLVVPSWLGYAFSIFLLRQFFRTVPMELSEAARIDGSSEFRTYWQIIMPLAKPALITVVLYEFVWTWNDFLAPLLYINDVKRWTLSLGLLQFRSDKETFWELLMAASTLTTLPAVILYFFGQKTFIEGIATTGFN
jgi:multiple sugar transport system permease protein